MRNIKIGYSGGVEDLEVLCDNILLKDDLSVLHFGLGLRTGTEKIPKHVTEKVIKTGLSVSVHVIDFNFSTDINASDIDNVISSINGLPIQYMEEDAGIWKLSKCFLGAHQLNPIQTFDSIARTVENISTFQNITGIPFSLENAPVYSMHGDIQVSDYYARICESANCFLALDLGHFLGSLMAEGRHDDDLPTPDHPMWNYVNTIHLSGMKKWIWNGLPVWLDQHGDIFDDVLIARASVCVERAVNLDNFLLEMEGASKETRKYNIGKSQLLLAN